MNMVRRNAEIVNKWNGANNLSQFMHCLYSYQKLWGGGGGGGGGIHIHSAEGVQQGDPLGPMLFCLTLHYLSLSFTSGLCIKLLYILDLTSSMFSALCPSRL